jgi:hypothetical protein
VTTVIDVDRRIGPAEAGRAPASPDESADALVSAWILAHPAEGHARLAALSAAGDARAERLLTALTPKSPTEGDILAQLDDAVRRGAWPELFGASPDTAYHAMRLVAARAAGGHGWGIVFQRVEGDGFDAAGLGPYRYGSNVPPGYHDHPDGRALPFYREDEDDPEPASPFDLDDVEVVGPAGPLELSSAMIGAMNLRPGRVTGARVASSRYALMLRAYLTAHPGAFWGDPRGPAALLDLGDAVDIVVVSDAFEHCVGPSGPEAYPAEWRALPSASRVYRSLARALVARDPSLFVPGTSNLDFRHHALAETGELAVRA